MKELTAEMLIALAENEDLLEVGRKAIEDMLRKDRDGRICMPFRGNGLVIKEKDGSPSDIIRMGPETALYVGLKAIAKNLDERRQPE